MFYRNTDEPCTRCGSSMEDCDCCAEYELRSSMQALGIQTTPDTYHHSMVRSRSLAERTYDLATLNRMLREFGY